MLEVTTNPTALPAACLLCPGSVRERYIDTGVQIDFFGAIYLCEPCIIGMAALLGGLSPAQAAAKERELADLTQENYNLLKQVAAFTGMREVVRELVDAGVVDLPQPVAAHLLLADATGQGDESPTAGDAAPSGLDSVGTGAGAPDEPGDDSHLAGLRSDAQSSGDFHLRI